MTQKGEEALGGGNGVLVGLEVYPGDAVRRQLDVAGVQGASQGSNHGTLQGRPLERRLLLLCPGRMSHSALAQGKTHSIATHSVLGILSVGFCH